MIEIQKVKLVKMFLFVFLTLTFVSLSHAETNAATPADIAVFVDGKPLDMPVAPVIIEGRTFIGVRSVGEAVGGEVAWEPETRKVTVTRRTSKIILTIGEQDALVDGKPVSLDVAPQIIEDRTMVPLRFIAEALGGAVDWNTQTRTVNILRKPTEITSMTYVQDVGKTKVTLRLSEPPASITPEVTESRLDLRLAPAVIKTDQTSMLLFDALMKVLHLQAEGRTVSLQAHLWNSPTYRYALSDDGTTLTLEFDYTVTEIQAQQEGRALVVNIASTGKLNYTALELKSPARLVFDMVGTHLAPTVSASQDVGHPLLTRIRTALFSKDPDTVRVVLDLEKEHPYEVVSTELGLQVRFFPQIEAVTTEKLQGKTRLKIASSLPVDAKVTVPTGKKQIRIEVPQTRSNLKENPIRIADGTIESVTVTSGSGNSPTLILINLPYYLGHSVSSKEGDPYISLDLITSSVYGKRIWVDAGHGKTTGGKDDPGAIGPTYKTKEKTANLQVALELQRQLTEAGAQVFMTRTGDEGLDFTDRPALVNAQKPPIDLFISIHHNSAMSTTTRGTETYYWTTHPKSRQIADVIHAAVVKALGFPDRQVRKQDFFVIKETKAPSILIELGYLSSPAEEKEIAEPNQAAKTYAFKAATGIVNGILEYFRQEIKP